MLARRLIIDDLVPADAASSAQILAAASDKPMEIVETVESKLCGWGKGRTQNQHQSEVVYERAHIAQLRPGQTQMQQQVAR